MIIDYVISDVINLKASVMFVPLGTFVDLLYNKPDLSSTPSFKTVEPTAFPSLFKLTIPNDPTIPDGCYMICYHNPTTNEVVNISSLYIVNGFADVLQTTKKLTFGVQ